MATLESRFCYCQLAKKVVDETDVSYDERILVLRESPGEAREAHSGCIVPSVKAAETTPSPLRDLSSVNKPRPFCVGSVSFTEVMTSNKWKRLQNKKARPRPKRPPGRNRPLPEPTGG